MKFPRRIRTEKEALKYLNDNAPNLLGDRRQSASARIRSAKQPNVEAKRIVEKLRLEKYSEVAANDRVDLSDVQELRVRLFRRDGGVTEPHSSLLLKLEIDILTVGVSPQEFKRHSALIMSLASYVPKNAWGPKS